MAKKKAPKQEPEIYTLADVIGYLQNTGDESQEMSLAIAVLEELEETGEVTTEADIELEDCILSFELEEETEDAEN